MIKMAAVVVWRSQHRRNLRRNRVFRDRKNPLDMYDDVELYDKFRFRRHDILTIVDELLDDLEGYPLRVPRSTRDKDPCRLLCKL